MKKIVKFINTNTKHEKNLDKNTYKRKNNNNNNNNKKNKKRNYKRYNGR